MASVAPLISMAASEKLSPTRKIPSPYRSTPVKNQYSRSSNKVSRNNTFIATSRGSAENGGDGLHFLDNANDLQGKAKCASAGAVEGLKPQIESETCGDVVDIFKGEDITFSEGSEENHQVRERDTCPEVAPSSITEDILKKPSAIPVKTKTIVGRPIRSQRSFISGNDSKTIKFLLKLTTKSYFETLKYEIERIKDNERKIQDQVSSNAHSIMALINKGVEFDRKMEDLRAQNARLLIETREKDRAQQDTVNVITSELNELKSVCNLLLKNIEKDHELEILARKLRKSKRFDSNTYKMLRTQLRKPLKLTESRKALPTLVSNRSSTISSLTRARSEAALRRQRSKASQWSSAKQKNGWSSLSSMSSVETGSDMLTDIEITLDRKSRSTGTSRKSLKPSVVPTQDESDHKLPVKQIKTKKRTGLMKIFCCGSGPRTSKRVNDKKES